MFHGRERVIEHVKRNGKCRRFYMEHIPDVPAAERAHLEEMAQLSRQQLVTQGKHAFSAAKISVKMPGPRCKEWV